MSPELLYKPLTFWWQKSEHRTVLCSILNNNEIQNYLMPSLYTEDGLLSGTGDHRAGILLTAEFTNTNTGPVHMIKGQLIALGQLIDPGVNFASVHGLTPVTVHMSFSLPRGNLERRVTRCTTPDNPPCRGSFSPCEQNAKVAPRQE